ncbi:MAG: right-handed parallel beta-helix repeat-containing protein [Fimbriimonadaceae bacterium]|nr:right-handed parallel beta-helix repeat-containing protein [Fimbriimonadaceae bacterium]
MIAWLLMAVTAVEIPVAACGARGDGRSDDGPAFRTALDRARWATEPATVVCEPRVYRFAPFRDEWAELLLRGADEVTIDGRGATWLLPPQNRALWIDRCRRITVRNLTIDYDPLPFTQGTVTAIDQAGGWFEFALDDGYPTLPSQSWIVANGSPFDWRHGVFTTAAGRFTHRWLNLGEVLPAGERRYRVKPRDSQGYKLDQIAVGQRFACRVPGHPKEWKDRLFTQGSGPLDRGVFLHGGPLANVRVSGSDEVLLEDLRSYAAADMSFHLQANGAVTLRRVTVARKPGTNRLLAGMSDGVHCKTNAVGPVLEDCSFEALADDSVNLSTHPECLLERRGPGQFTTQYGDIVWFDSPLTVGDRMLVFDPRSGRSDGEVIVREVQFVSNQRRLVTLDRDLPAAVLGQAAGLDAATQLYRLPRTPPVVRRCRFASQLKTAVLLRGAGLVEDCEFRDCAYGVHAHNSAGWREGPFPDRLTIRGCRFENVWLAAVNILSLAPELAAPFGRDIVVADNQFIQREGHGIDLVNLAAARVTGNQVTMAAETPSQYVALRLVNCAEVRLRGLTVSDPRPGQAPLRLEQMPAERLIREDG